MAPQVEAPVDGSQSLRMGIGSLCLVALPLLGSTCSPPEPGERASLRGGSATEEAIDPSDTSRWQDVNLAHFFAGVEGTFVLLDAATGETLVHDADRAATPFLPASTYKIPHTLIALEAEVADGPDFSLEWDPETVPAEPWWPEGWTRDQTLAQAFSGSVVWYYQEVARRIGPEQMESALARFQYGNGDLSAGLDSFWLNGAFGISAEEQAFFLQRLLRGDFGLSEKTMAAVKELLLIEEEPGHRLSGKTGWVGFGDPSAPQVGWFVGYLESDRGTFIFALNLDIQSTEDVGRRTGITRDILGSLELL